MSIYEGSLSIISYDAWINDIKNLLINSGGFTLVRDTGTALSKVVVLSKTGYTHNLKIYYIGSTPAFSILTIDGLTDITYTKNVSDITTVLFYRFVVYNNTIALFLSYSGIFRCVFIYTKSDTNYIQLLRQTNYSTTTALIHISQSTNTTFSASVGFCKYQYKTVSFFQILTPIYVYNDVGAYLLDNPANNLFGFANASLLNEGTKISVSSGSYITASCTGSAIDMLIRYA